MKQLTRSHLQLQRNGRSHVEMRGEAAGGYGHGQSDSVRGGGAVVRSSRGVQLRQRWGPRWLRLEICQCDWGCRKVWAWRGGRWESCVLVYGCCSTSELAGGVSIVGVAKEQPHRACEDSGRDITSSRTGYSASELVVGVSRMLRQDAFAVFPSGLSACNATNRQPSNDLLHIFHLVQPR